MATLMSSVFFFTNFLFFYFFLILMKQTLWIYALVSYSVFVCDSTVCALDLNCTTKTRTGQHVSCLLHRSECKTNEKKKCSLIFLRSLKSVLDLQTIVYISKNVYVWISSKSSCFFIVVAMIECLNFLGIGVELVWNGRKTTKNNRSNLEDYAIIRELKFFKSYARRHIEINMLNICFDWIK